MAGPGLTIAIHCFPVFVNPKISIDIPCVQLPFLLAHTSENQHVTGRIVTSNIGQSSSMIFHVGLGVCIHLGYFLMSMAFCCSMGRCVSPHPWGCHWTSPTSLAKSQPCAGHWIAGQHWSNTVRVSKLLIANKGLVEHAPAQCLILASGYRHLAQARDFRTIVDRMQKVLQQLGRDALLHYMDHCCATQIREALEA